VLLKITVEQNGVILGQSIVEIDDDESLSVAIKSAVDTVRAQDPSKPLWGLGIKVDKLAWLLSSFRVVESGRGRGAERRSGLKARAGVADGLVRGASAIMPAIDLVNLSALLDDAKCFALVRQHRWREGVRCPGCGSDAVIRNGCDDTQPHRQRYRCKACAGRFDDLTGTVLAGHHQPLRVWVLCLYLMGLNLSNRQIALELKLSPSDAQAMTEQLRRGLVARIPEARLAGEVEIDEVYVVAGHKGQPAAVAKRGARGGDAS
jgi:transposase-like protein